MAWAEKYCTATGAGAHDGSSEANAWDLPEAIAGVAPGDRVNVKAGTFANGSSSLNWSTSGTTTAPIWWRGYETVIGDQDDAPPPTQAPGTDIPLVTWDDASGTVSGSYNTFSAIAFRRNDVTLNARTMLFTGAHIHADRCWFDNLDSDPGSSNFALRCSGNGFIVERCWLHVVNTNALFVAVGEERGLWHGNYLQGPAASGSLFVDLTAGSQIVDFNVMDSPAGDGINVLCGGSAILQIDNNTIYHPGGHGIALSGTMPASGSIKNNLITDFGGDGIANVSGTDTAHIFLLGNDFYNGAGADLSGFGDVPNVNGQTESSSPFTNAAAGDFSLVNTANACSNGQPGMYDNASFTSYLDIGAVQQAPGGGGGGNSNPILAGTGAGLFAGI